MMGDICDEKISNFLDGEIQKLEMLINFEFLKNWGKNFKQEVNSFLELIKQMLASNIFQKISDLKIKLMMEAIQLNYLFLQFMDTENFHQITSKILEIRNNTNKITDQNSLYKRKPVNFFFQEIVEIYFLCRFFYY